MRENWVRNSKNSIELMTSSMMSLQTQKLSLKLKIELHFIFQKYSISNKNMHIKWVIYFERKETSLGGIINHIMIGLNNNTNNFNISKLINQILMLIKRMTKSRIPHKNSKNNNYGAISKANLTFIASKSPITSKYLWTESWIKLIAIIKPSAKSSVKLIKNSYSPEKFQKIPPNIIF